MDEAALLPAMLYVLLTVTAVALAVHTVPWLELTGATATLIVLAVLFEAGFAYERAKTALR